MWRKGNSCVLLVGMQIDTATMESNMELSTNSKEELP